MLKSGKNTIGHEEIEKVRGKCIFTTHTPMAAGHDQFPLDFVQKAFGSDEYLVDMQDMYAVDVQKHILWHGGEFGRISELAQRGVRLNMSYLALNMSKYINGVFKEHGEVSRLMFADYRVDAITNGVHAATWTTDPIQELFDRHIPG
jgi:starch phosphorylase